MGALDFIFGGNQQQQQPAQQQQQQQQPAQQPQQPAQPPQGNIPSQPTTVPDTNNPTVPAGMDNPPQQEESPLAAFADLWNNDNTNQQSQTPDDVYARLKPEDVQKVIAKADFSSVITPEQLAAIGNGGEAAQQAFAQAINSVAQRVMLQSTLVNNNLSMQAMQKAITQAESRIPDAMRKYSSADYSRTANPLLSNPAVKPVADAVQAQLLAKNPNATNAEITQMTQDFIAAMGAQFAPKQEPINNSATNDTDWDAFFKM